jgi:hypothetical protein
MSNFTIEEYCKMWYDEPQKMARQIFKKVDAPLYTGTGATVYSALYGRQAFTYLNLASNVWSLLRKEVWDRSGWRVMTTAPTWAAGVSEVASLPETVKPTLATLKATPKQIIGGWNVSLTMDALVGKDDVFDPAALRQAFAEGHAHEIDKMLLTDVSTVASNNIESIDRVCSSMAESTVANNMVDVATDGDIYGVDRDAATTYDAQVIHNSATPRDLTLSLINELIRKCRTAGARTEDLIFLTGYDTYDTWVSLLEAKQRFMGEAWATKTINGVQTLAGVEGGFQVSTYDGIPIFFDDDVKKDTISRIYLIDTSNVFIKVLMPTNYISKPFPTSDTLTNEAYFLTIAELGANRFNTSGKIRDLQ